VKRASVNDEITARSLLFTCALALTCAVTLGAAATPATPLAPAPLELEVTQVLTVPVTSIALGDGSRIAVLADAPYIGDARGLRAVPLPPALRAKPGDKDQVQIFFGRDNEPRIMGSRRSASGETAIYWRHAPSGWRDGREEIGQLGGTTQGGLWGVLGAADPELVCRARAQCIIKRTSGWTVAPAGPAPRIVHLQDGVLWGLDASGIAGIDAHGWSIAIPAPTWSDPKTFWATRGEAWVSEDSTLFHDRDSAWTKLPSPVGAVTSWWGQRSDSLWVVGAAGAAHFDGRGFRSVTAHGRALPALRVVRGRSDAEVWLGGDAGLFRALPSAL
jgi:hypothetical protein